MKLVKEVGTEPSRKKGLPPGLLIIVPVIAAPIILGIIIGTHMDRKDRLRPGAKGIVAHYGEETVAARLPEPAGACLPEGEILEVVYLDCLLTCGTIYEIERVEPGRAIVRTTQLRTSCRGRPARSGSNDASAAVPDECPVGSFIALSPASASLGVFRYDYNKAEIEAEFLLP